MPAPAGPAAVFWTYTSAYFLSCVLRSANASLDETLAATFSLGEAAVGLLSSLFFLAFAATQVPFGNLIDRVGPRRAQLVALPFAIAGLLFNAWATGFPLLAVGRVLLGVGFSISLMAALCANRASFPVGSLAGVNGAAVGIGSSGAAFAGAPLAGMVASLGWTGVHLALAAASALVLLLMLALPRDAVATASAQPDQPRMRAVIADPVFRRLAPMTALAQGSYLAYLGYWIHPWLQSVAAFDAFTASVALSLASLTMVAGHLLTGHGTRRLMRSGRTLEQTAVIGMLAVAGSQMALALLPAAASLPLWLAYGFLGAFNIVAFSVLSALLPTTIQGTAVTLLNLMIFAVGFAVQAGLGACIELLGAAGVAASTAHRASMLVIGLAIVALAARWRRLGGAARGASAGRT